VAFPYSGLLQNRLDSFLFELYETDRSTTCQAAQHLPGNDFQLEEIIPDRGTAFNEIEKWRAFALAHVIGPEQITRLAR